MTGIDEAFAHADPGERLSLILLVRNVEIGIRQAILRVDKALAASAGEYEIIVVDDGSDDGTAAVVLKVMGDLPQVRLLRHSVTQGSNAALRTALEIANFDKIALADVDCQLCPSDLASLLHLSSAFPVVVGIDPKRRHGWSDRTTTCRCNASSQMSPRTSVGDGDCGLKIVNKEALTKLLCDKTDVSISSKPFSGGRRRRYQFAETKVRALSWAYQKNRLSTDGISHTVARFLSFWWTQILFPGPSPGPTDKADAARSRWHVLAGLLILLVPAAILFFSRLGCPLQEPQEPRYAEISRQMLIEGRWVIPVLHGQAYYQKPPLLYWLVMGNYLLWGVHDWSARLTPCFAGFLTVLMTYFWGCRAVGVRAGFAGALILCLSARFVYLGRLLTMDGLLCLWVVTGLAAAHLAIQGPRFRWRWWLLSAVASGLGLLTKGPVACVLVAAPVLLGNFVDERFKRPGWRGWMLYIVTAVGLAAPWYGAAIFADENFAQDFFWLHNVQRFLTPFDHEEPIWFYLPGLLLGMLPWTLLLPGFLMFLKQHSRRTAAYRPPALGFFLLAFGWCVLFFSLAGCKRSTYILPGMPALALALGCYVNALLPNPLGARMGSIWVHRASLFAHRTTLGMLAVGVLLSLTAVYFDLLKPVYAGFLAVTVSIGLGLVYRYGLNHRSLVSWVLCACVAFLLLFVAIEDVLPRYARRFSLRGEVRPLAQADCVYSSIVCYPRRWDSVSFYLQRQDVQIYSPSDRPQWIHILRQHPSTLVFVKAAFAREFLDALPSNLEFTACGRQGKLLVGCVRRR